MSGTIIVAQTVVRAMGLSCELGIAEAVLVSPRSVRQGAGRGVVADAILIDDTAVLDGGTLDELRPALIASGGPVYRLQRVLP